MPFFAAAEHRSPSPNIPSLSVPVWAMAGGRRRTFLLQTQREVQAKAEKGRQLWDHSTWPPASLSARLSPDGAEGQAVAATVALPDHLQKSDQLPARCQQRAFWAIFGHFRRSPLSVHSTATEAPPEFQHSHPILQSTLAPPQLCPPSLEGGHNCRSYRCQQATFLPSLSTILDASPACLQAPLPEAGKTHAVEAWFTKHPGVKVNWL